VVSNLLVRTGSVLFLSTVHSGVVRIRAVACLLAMANNCLYVLVRSNPVMKLVVMVTLLLSDADVLFTYASFYPYAQKGYAMGPILLGIFSLVYLAGAYYGNEQRKKFCKSLREGVESGQYLKRNCQPVTMDDVRGKSGDEFRRFMIQEGLGDKYYQARAKFIRNMVKIKHSIPLFRLAKFGWMADIPAGDFAGILNANALYSFTLGFPQMGLSVAFWMGFLDGQMDPVIMASLVVSSMSLVLSVMNVLVAFPKVLNDLEEQRQQEIEVQREVESKTRAHIEGLRRERDEKTKRVEGKASGTEEFLRIMASYQKEEEKVRKAVTEMVKKESERSQRVDVV